MPDSMHSHKSAPTLLQLFPVLLINLTAFGIAIPILPALCKGFGGTAVAVGLLFTLQALGQFVMAPRWGRLSDRFGRKPILMATLCLAVCVDVATAWTGSLEALYIVRFVAGLAAGNVATASAYIADITPVEKRSKGMALIGICFGLGFTVGPGLGAGISHLAPDASGPLGVGIPFLCSAGLNVVACALAQLLLKEPNKDAHDRQTKRAIFKGEGSTRPSQLLKRPGVAQLTRFILGYSIAVTILETTIYYYMADRYGYDERQVGLIFAGMGLLAAGVQGGGVARISKRFGDEAMTLGGAILIGVGLVASTGVESLWYLLPWLAIAAIGRALTQPGSLALMSAEALEPRESGALMGMVQSANSAGRIIGPLCGGWLFVHLSPRAPFIAAGVVILISSGIWYISKKSFPKPSQADT